MALLDRVRGALRALRGAPVGILSSLDTPAEPTGGPDGGSVKNRRDDGYVPSPPTLVVDRQLPIQNESAWDVPSVNAALDEHENGRFVQSAKLAVALRRDDRIYGCIESRIRALAGLPFEVLPNPHASDAGKAIEAAQRSARAWPRICPASARSKLQENTAIMGFAVAAKQHQFIDGEWLPILDPWPLQHVYWNWSDGWYAITTTGTVAIENNPTGWFLHTPHGQHSWYAGAIRALGLLFVFRAFTYRDWARYCEKHGLPILVIKEPADLDSGAKRRFYDKIRTLGKESTIRAPKNTSGESVEVTFVEPRDNSWESFLKFKEAIEISIAIVLLGQNLTTEVTGGSYAAANVHYNIRLDLLAGDVVPFNQAAERQVLREYLRNNMPGFTDDLTPLLTNPVKPPEDDAARATQAYQISQAIETLLRGNGSGQGVISPIEARGMLAEARILPKGAKVETLPEKVEPPAPKLPPPLPGAPGVPPKAPPVPPKPGAEKPKPGADKKTEEKASLSTETLTAEDDANAQSFVDDTVAAGVEHARVAMRPDLRAVLDAIEHATDPEDAKRRLLAAHARMSPRHAASLVRDALLLGDLAGRLAAKG